MREEGRGRRQKAIERGEGILYIERMITFTINDQSKGCRRGDEGGG